MKTLIITCIIVCVCVFNIHAKRIEVPNQQTTIQSGINAATDGDTILVAEGLYYENINFIGKAITVGSHFILDGDTSHISKTIIDGSKAADPRKATVVRFDNCLDTTSILNGFTITGGKGTLNNQLGHNVTTGGGVSIANAGGKVIYNKISGNSTIATGYTTAAGIGISNISTNNYHVIIAHNQIFNNYTRSQSMSFGAGISMHMSNGKLIIDNNEIYSNTTECSGKYKAIGAGIFVEKAYGHPAEITIRNNAIHHNNLICPASMGAGIYVVFYRDKTGENMSLNVPIEIYNNLITDNISPDKGGGIAIWNMAMYYGVSEQVPDPVVTNNTIINNKASDGAGIFNYDAETILLNNIIWNDLTTENCREVYNDDIHYSQWAKDKNIGKIYANSNNIQKWIEPNIPSWYGSSNINKDPNFNPNSFDLLNGSPCIGAGTDSVELEGVWYKAPPYDFNGSIRSNPANTVPDIGAIESPLRWPVKVASILINNKTLHVHPNPTIGALGVHFSVTKKQVVKLGIYNVLGQREKGLLNEVRTPGTYEVQVDISALPSGVYFIVLESDTKMAAKLIKQ